MTDREIKLELAKTALNTGVSFETVHRYYKWIMEGPDLEVVDKQTQWDNTPIEELAYKTRIEGTIIKRCHDNGISTVGDLIRCGGHKFRKFKNVGGGTVTKIEEALEQYYDIVDWYRM